MAKGKKEPINITPPTPPQFLVKSERVKFVVMFVKNICYFFLSEFRHMTTKIKKVIRFFV